MTARVAGKFLNDVRAVTAWYALRLKGVDVLQSSRDKDKIRRLRAEIAEQHESIMELISECAIRFNGLPQDIYRALTESICLPLQEQPEARRAVRDRMLRLLALNEEDQQSGTDVPRRSRDDANR